MKRVLELGLPFIIVSAYMKTVSFSGMASVMLIRRWSMLRPLNIVFINDYIDTLIISMATLFLTTLSAYRYKDFQTYILLILSSSSLILSIVSYHYISTTLSLLVALYLTIRFSLIRKDIASTRMLTVFFSIAVLIGLLSLSGWILYFIYGGVNPYREPTPLQDVEAKLLYSFSAYTPILVIIFLLFLPLTFIVKPLAPIEGSRPAEILEKFKNFLKRLNTEFNDIHNREFTVWSLVLFISSILMPIFITFSLYSKTVNPSGMIVGVDILNYVDKIGSILLESPTDKDILVNLVKTDRPLPLLFIYYASTFLYVPIKTFSMYASCLLAPLLAVATYFLARRIFRNTLYSSLTSFMISTGPYTAASLYGGFLANWLGLSITFASIAALFKALEEKSAGLLIFSIILSILSHLSHPIPWSFMVAAVTLYGLFYMLKKDRNPTSLKFIWIFTLINIAFDIIKTRVLRFSGASLVAHSMILTDLSLENLLNFWEINVFMFYYHVGGAFNFPPTYLLAILGMILLQSRNVNVDCMKTWIIIGLPIYLFGPDYFQARTLQNIPIDFFTSAGAITIFYYLFRRDKISANLLLLLVLLTYLNNTLRFSANLPF